MNHNESDARQPAVRSGPGRQPYSPQYAPQAPRPFVPEDTLATAEIQIERKYFVLILKENARGRFLRIVEEVGGKHNSIMIPSTGLAEFKKLVDEMVQHCHDIPAKPHIPPPDQGAAS